MCGIVAAAVGSDVVLTDHEGYPHVLQNARSNCKLNDSAVANAGGHLRVAGLSWGTFGSNAFDIRSTDLRDSTVLIGADILYSVSLFDSVFATTHFFGTPLLTVFQHRFSFLLAAFTDYYSPCVSSLICFVFWSCVVVCMCLVC